MAIDYKLIGPGFAAEISGVDLAEDWSDKTIERVREIWFDHKLVIFRNQNLEDKDLERFVGHFGEIFVHIRSQFHSSGNPGITLVSNVKKEGKPIGALGDYGIGWHCDQIYREQPAFSTILYGVEIPSEGGNTLICDLAQAYAKMPTDLKAKIDGKRAVYSIAKITEKRDYATTQKQQAASPDVAHPLVRRHPYTGRPSLFFSPDHTVRIDGIAEDEQEEVQRQLVDWASQERFVYEHSWQIGDVIMWDNSSTMHRRGGFPSSERRLLKRTGFMLPEDLATPLPAET
ncbi:MAG: taurine dioxygenase [Rhodospirillaceae bacterium]|nr:taurine dioxygenase [Rhodospirillaceae bacterium]HAA91133.1 taurine dioxygenase [Rhodospirillaceae bacterium]|tara:strand:- start:568 stop:1428 length:861 start_codon:yes stop_codon:yes gene_type:complete